MPRHVVTRLAECLDARCGRGLNGARVLVLGVAYKKNVDDVRESPALEIMDLLAERGAEVVYHDPFVAEVPGSRAHARLARRRPVALTPAEVAAADAVLVVTDHDGVDYQGVVAAARLVVDTRNATRDATEGREKIVRA